MEEPNGQSASVVEEPTAISQASSGEPEAEQPTPEQRNAVVNDAFRARAGGFQSTLKPEASEQVGESTEFSDVKPTSGDGPVRDASGRFVPRRGVPEAIRTADERIADLERQLAERDPATIRQQILDEQAAAAAGPDDEQQARADADRFLSLRDLPDDHPKLVEGDNWQWLQEQKKLRADYPKAERALRAWHQKQAEDAIASRDQAVLGALRRHVALPGVDEPTFRKLSDWGDLGDHLYEAGRRSLEPELTSARDRIAELEREQQQARFAGPRGLGSARLPIEAGRSAAPAPGRDINDIFRSAGNGRS